MLKSMLIGLLAIVPGSTNFILKNYDVGNGVGASTSANYRLLPAVANSGLQLTSTNYSLPAGITQSSTIARPAAPALTNPDSSYNRLHLTLASSTTASDTKYVIAISSDGFATTQYVKADQTIGATATISDYKTYSAWGSASGFWILGLQPATTYAVKVAALQGAFTGSGFGASTSGVITASPTLTMSIGIGASTTPPFTVAFANVSAGAVTTSPSPIRVILTTNAQNGGVITMSDTNGGLYSAANNFTLSSVTGDLSVLSSGYGAQASAVGQISGGPISKTSPYDGTGDNVGNLTVSAQTIASFTTPISGASTDIALKAKAAVLTPAASDYADTLTISARANF